MTGSSAGFGVREMSHRRAPLFSCHPVRIGNYLWSYMMTLFFVKITLQSALQMVQRPIRVWWKEEVNFTAQGKSVGNLGITKSYEPIDWCGWPLTVPTVIIGAVGSKLIVGAFFEKYNPLALESIIAVW